VALIYAVFGTIWIVASDRVAVWLFYDEASLLLAQTLKGLFYVVTTSLLVYWLARRAVNEVTSRRMENQLQSTQKMLDKILTSLGDAVFLIDPTTRTILQCNPAAERLFGYQKSALSGQKTRILYLSEQDYQEFGILSEEVLAQGKVFHTEFRMRKKDDTIIKTEHTITAIDEDLGWKSGVISIIHDITERKQVMEELRQSEARHRTLVETIPDLVWLKDLDGVYLGCNPTFERFFGASEAEIVGRTDYDFRDKQLADFFRDHDRKALAANGPSINEEMLTFADDGYSGCFETIKTPVRDAEGRPVGVLGIARDISRLKQAEESLRKSQALLKETGDLARIGGWEIDLVSNTVYWTQTMKTIYEVSEDFVPTFEKFVNIFAPAIRAEIRRTLQRSCEQDAPFNMEVPFVTANGQRLWSYFMGRPEYSDYTCIRLYGTFQDITQRRILEGQVHQSQKMESVGRLAGGVAHDFNNMLGVILGNAELALQGLDPANPVHLYLQEILSASKRSADLTRQLLAFARKQTIEPKVLDLNDTVASMLKMVGRMLREDISLNWKPAGKLGPVKMDPSQLDQILANLIVNARDAIKGVGNIVIETGMATFNEQDCQENTDMQPGHYVVLSVNDDGSGMDQETQSKIFEPFFTTKDRGEGTGLGLATVFGIVKQNEGFIHVYSEPGEGTTFRIYLPGLSAAEFPQADSADSVKLESGDETILLVEDEMLLLKLTQRLLETLGYQVLATSSPDEALEMARAHPHPIHLLMTDVVMPAMNGRELWQEIAGLRPAAKCLFMSGHSADLITHKGVLDQDVNFLQKPVSIQALALKLRRVIEDGHDA